MSEYEREEYNLLPLKSRHALAIEELNRNLNNGVGAAPYYALHSDISNDIFFKPLNPSWTFGEINTINYTHGSYRRFGNVVLEFHAPLNDCKIEHEGTLYISTKGAWQLIDEMGLTVSSGSGGINFDVFHNPEKLTKKLSTKHERIERFQDIV